MSSKQNWVLQVDPRVTKSLKRFPPKDVKRIITAIESIQSNPFTGDIQKIHGETNVWRRRVGSYRIFCELHPTDRIVHIFHVERRTSITY